MQKTCKFCDNKRFANLTVCLEHHRKQEEAKNKAAVYKKYTKKKKPLTDQQKTEKKRKKCVALAKEISKIKEGYKCQYCGVGKPQRQIHSHHMFHEGFHRPMSADVDNLITLCASHHQSFAGSKYSFSFHSCPTESTEWFKKHYPERYKSLLARSKKIIPLSYHYWEAKEIELKAILSDLKQEMV